MAKLSKAELASIIASYVDGSKIGADSFTASYTQGLLDKIAKTFNIETSFVDKLGMFDGDDLGFGKTLEEWASDLILPEAFDESGSGALAPHSSTYRPVEWSYTLGRKKIPQTIRYNEFERACNNAQEFGALIANKTKVMYDSETLLKYGIKRQALGTLIAKCVAESSSTTYYASITSSTAVNTVIKKDANATITAILVKKLPSTKPATYDDAVAGGYLVELDLVKGLAKPVDTTTGEAFVEDLKKAVEVAEDFNEGHSLNGNTLGATPVDGLVLVVKQGIQPVIETQVQAGAFHMDKVAIPCKIVVVPDFGNANADYYAVLMDARGMRLHNSYRAVRENVNGDGDFLNMFFHTENTVHISRNTFVRVYKNA